jgi:uncharacterized membrane protein
LLINNNTFILTMQPSDNIKQRITSIDILRGVIMIIMALDHVRDFFGKMPFDALDLTHTTPQLFLTRWITHFCAPVFVFLSGVSAYLSAGNNSSKEVSGFLLKRGLWLLLLEVTIINFGWFFDPAYHIHFLQVIWVFGWSMISLSALVYIKPLYVGLFGVVLIVGHNALDGIRANTFGSWKLAWMLLHEQGFMPLGAGKAIFVVYPIIPWIGVMAAGYGFGVVFKLESSIRKQWLLCAGIASLLLFVVLRFFNIYGDPFPWQHQSDWWKNLLAFVRCQKYPPSLQYLLMTLGTAMVVLALIENTKNKITHFFTVFGKVPFFYYLLHIYLIHLMQLLIAAVTGFPIMSLLSRNESLTSTWGFNLPFVYLIWIIVIAVLYFPCRWFMKVKQRRKYWWLSYM